MKHLKLFPLLCCLILSFTSESQTNYRSSISSNQQTANSTAHSKKVVGYFAQWAIYGRDYNVLDIEGDKLTHIMYAFFDTTFDAATETSSIESIDSYADFEHNESGMHPSSEPVKGNIGDLRLLKQNYPHLKVLISLGGWTRSQNFPALAKSVNGRLTLAQSMVNFMETYTWIDGFDIDWEFPVEGGIQGETVNGIGDPEQPGATLTDDHYWIQKVQDYYINYLVTSVLGEDPKSVLTIPNDDFLVFFDNQQLHVRNKSNKTQYFDFQLFDLHAKKLFHSNSIQLNSKALVTPTSSTFIKGIYIAVMKTQSQTHVYKIISK